MTEERLAFLAKKLMFEMKKEEYETLKDEFDIILKQMDLIIIIMVPLELNALTKSVHQLYMNVIV